MIATGLFLTRHAPPPFQYRGHLGAACQAGSGVDQSYSGASKVQLGLPRGVSSVSTVRGALAFSYASCSTSCSVFVVLVWVIFTFVGVQGGSSAGTYAHTEWTHFYCCQVFSHSDAKHNVHSLQPHRLGSLRGINRVSQRVSSEFIHEAFLLEKPGSHVASISTSALPTITLLHHASNSDSNAHFRKSIQHSNQQHVDGQCRHCDAWL